VQRLPADTVERLRKITPQILEQRLSVLAQWKLQGGQYMPAAPGPNIGAVRGVRREGDDLQMGLTNAEIKAIERLLEKLLKRIDAGEITLVNPPA